ncbi:hypothetical protein [Rhizobium sp. P28RR-XV]|uniref:hypothetical protein n=1 Tax=Rhizobium sp. P28RR-XV TaxID=2726737 RepID=UPI00197DE805|nr:hypothetical protein [Rhizobium sp. P28RR-XV]
MMMNCVIESKITSDDLRMIDWVADGDIKLRPRTYQQSDAAVLKASSNLFARKFDQTVDGEILLVLERHLAKQAVTGVDGSRAVPVIAPLPFTLKGTAA